jgi:hypothetical protein
MPLCLPYAMAHCTSGILRSGRVRIRSGASSLVSSPISAFELHLRGSPLVWSERAIRPSGTRFASLSRLHLSPFICFPSSSTILTIPLFFYIYFFALPGRLHSNSLYPPPVTPPALSLRLAFHSRLAPPSTTSFFGSIMTSPFLASILQLVISRPPPGSAAAEPRVVYDGWWVTAS